MKSIKNFCAAFLIVTLFYLSGCSSVDFDGEPGIAGSGSDKELTGEKVNIQIATWSLGYQKGIEEAIARFNRTNRSNIEITLLQIPKYKYTEILNMLMTSNDGPDIFGINNEWLDTYINRNWALNISQYADDDFLKDFPEWAIRFSKNPAFRGGIYTIPATMITSRLIYNKDLFESAGLDSSKPPTTMIELKEYALKISKAGVGNGKYGMAIPLGEDWAGFVQSMEMPLTYSGVYYYNFKKGTYDLDEYSKWFEMLADLKSRGGLYPGEATLKIDTVRAQFADGNIGMMFASSWEPSVLKNQYEMKCRWGVAMPPAFDVASTAKGKLMIVPGICYVVNPNSPEKEKVLEVWKYLYSRECLGEQYRQGGEIPVVEGITSDPEFKPDIENYSEFLPGKDDSPWPNVPIGSSEWERFLIYKEANEKYEKAGTILQHGAAKLNEQFMNKVAVKVIDIRDYTDKDFDPRQPLK